MKQSEIQLGATYRGKTGIRRRVLDDPKKPSPRMVRFIQLEPGGGYNANAWYRVPAASFARWAVARVDEKGEA